MWPTATAPTGWLLANGAAVSRSTYSALFGVIGVVFGAGDTTTTFNVPNYTNRMPIGAGGLYAIGDTGGSKDATVPEHNHTATSTDSGHSHTYSGNVDPIDTFQYSGGGGNAGVGTPENAGSTTATGTASITTTVANAGTSPTGANLPPYLGIQFIIKT